MRILVVTYRLPVYPGDAPSNTIFHLVKHLSRNHEVFLAGLAHRTFSRDSLERISQYCRRVEWISCPKWRGAWRTARGVASSEPLQMWYYRTRAFSDLVQKIIAEEKIELAYGYHLRSAQFLANLDSIPRVLAIQPAQVLHFGRRYQLTRHPILRAIYGMEYRRLVGYEAALAQRFDSCVLISNRDWDAIDPERRLDNVFLNPHGTDVLSYAPPADVVRESDTVVFSGSMSMDTNSNAAHYFHREILPLVWARRPETKFRIVGKDPPRSLMKLGGDRRISITGTVPDIRPYLWKSSVGVDPVRMAAGMQNKLIEGMAAGLPMVITPEANEGIRAPEGHAVLVGHTPEEFAAHVLLLLEDAERARTVATEGLAFVQAHWSWEHYFSCLEDKLNTLVGEQCDTATACRLPHYSA